MTYERLAEVWDSYRTRVIPPDAGEVQLVETERAFYAGAMTVLGGLARAAEHEDLAEAALDNWWRECRAFLDTQRTRYGE